MVTVKNPLGGGSGESASIFVSGLSSTDTVSATTPSGGTTSAVWRAHPRIPSIYQEVEYLQTDGTQYLSTGYALEGDDTVTIDIQSNGTTSDQHFIATSDCSTRLFVWKNYTRVACIVDNNWVPNSSYSSYPSLDALRHKWGMGISNGTATFYKDGTAWTTKSGVSATSSPLDIIDAYYTNVSPSKFYGYTHERDGEYIRNLVPCYRISDNVAGAYDLVSGDFLVNQRSGADFTVGDDVHYYSWDFTNLTEYGNYTITATGYETETVLVDGATEFEVEMTPS